MRLVIALCCLLVAAPAAWADAAEWTEPDFPDHEDSSAGSLADPPCDDCTLDVPDHLGPYPLIVVLHGDRESVAKWQARWRRPALERGWAILGLQCPKNDGCQGARWYRWNGSPRWVFTQVDKVARRISIDHERTYLIGWSGGATYIGKNLSSWASRFAAVVFHGGGVAPRNGRCPNRPFPAYFFVGDENRSHGATKKLRRHLVSCGQKTQWDLLSGATHRKEDKALNERKAEQILDWLDDHKRPQVVAGPNS